MNGLDLSVGASTELGREPVREHSGVSNITSARGAAHMMHWMRSAGLYAEVASQPIKFSAVDSSTPIGKWTEDLVLRNGSVVISGSQEKPPWVQPAFSKMQELVNLEPGWDSHDAAPVVDDSVVAAVEILSQTMSSDTKTPWIVPTVRGGIQIEWHKSQVHLEIEIKPDRTAFFFYVNEQDEREFEKPLDAAQVHSLLEEFKK